MQIIIEPDSYFIFDLDDTLFYEIDYLKSGYRHIAKQIELHTGLDYYDEMLERFYKRENVFQWLVTNPGIAAVANMEWLLREYREHLPNIFIAEPVKDFLLQLQAMNIPCGIITDGRSITQRNKLKALGIGHFFKDIIVSEEFGSAKPDERNYRYFEAKHPGSRFYFFGDNTGKDFIVPLQLGWQAFCIRNNGMHIHPQTLHSLNSQCCIINSFSEIQLIYNN